MTKYGVRVDMPAEENTKKEERAGFSRCPLLRLPMQFCGKGGGLETVSRGTSPKKKGGRSKRKANLQHFIQGEKKKRGHGSSHSSASN